MDEKRRLLWKGGGAADSVAEATRAVEPKSDPLRKSTVNVLPLYSVASIDGLPSEKEWYRKLGRRLNGELRGGRPFAPVALALLFYPAFARRFWAIGKYTRATAAYATSGSPSQSSRIKFAPARPPRIS